MGSPHREPRPQSPERLRVKRIDFAGHDPEDGAVTVTVSFSYDTWCCNGSHEVTDAISAVVDTFEAASESSEKYRLQKLEEEYKDAFTEAD